MKTTIDLDEELLRQAREETGIHDVTELVHTALRRLIAQGASRRLAALGGTMPWLRPIVRRRPAR